MNVITQEFLKTEESIYNLSKRLNISSEEILKYILIENIQGLPVITVM